MFTLEQDRIDLEETLVKIYLSGFRKTSLPSGLGFTGWVTPKTGSGSYELGLDARECPYGKPDLLVTFPRVLWMHGGRKSINSLGTTHSYHTWDNGPNGCVRICHTLGWDPSNSCVQVLLKGIIWLESYSIHLLTGITIAEIIDSFEEYYTIWSNPLIL
jgi:hypothetical protein